MSAACFADSVVFMGQVGKWKSFVQEVIIFYLFFSFWALFALWSFEFCVCVVFFWLFVTFADSVVFMGQVGKWKYFVQEVIIFYLFFSFWALFALWSFEFCVCVVFFWLFVTFADSVVFMGQVGKWKSFIQEIIFFTCFFSCVTFLCGLFCALFLWPFVTFADSVVYMGCLGKWRAFIQEIIQIFSNQLQGDQDTAALVILILKTQQHAMFCLKINMQGFSLKYRATFSVPHFPSE